MAEFFHQSRESAANQIKSMNDKVREAETLLSSLQFIKESTLSPGPSGRHWEIIDNHMDNLRLFVQTASDLDREFKRASEAGESLLLKK